jgi:hypothetical protein
MILEKGMKVRITKCCAGTHNGEIGIINHFGYDEDGIYANLELPPGHYGFCTSYGVESCPAEPAQPTVASELRKLADRLEAKNG